MLEKYQLSIRSLVGIHGMIRLSLIVSVLESHEVVRRQLLHLARVLSDETELIVIDDGSDPPIAIDTSVRIPHLHWRRTEDRRPWTQPKARNIGARMATAERLLFFDIDHIITTDVLHKGFCFVGDKMHWWRRPGILDSDGTLVLDERVLREHGMRDPSPSVHQNSFVIKRSLFELLGGYDERFCGRYGGDDIDFNRRYDQLCRLGRAKPSEVMGEGFVFPDPVTDTRGLFHSLPRQ